ncbi:MAG: DUF1372 family protein [Streptococcus sp.]|nr:DUF1372 family protein [Streptococcus sp.]
MKKRDTTVYFFLFLILCLIAVQDGKIKRLEARRPATIYYVDNMAGVVTGKEFDGERYSITVSGYGKFLVNKEQYDRAIIGKGWKHE